jgi:hypothetical protein
VAWVQSISVAVAVAAVLPTLLRAGLLGGPGRRRQAALREDAEILALLPDECTQREALAADIDRQVGELLTLRHGPRRNWRHVVSGVGLLVSALFLWAYGRVADGWKLVFYAEAAVFVLLGVVALGTGCARCMRNDDGYPVPAGLSPRDLWRALRTTSA